MEELGQQLLPLPHQPGPDFLLELPPELCAVRADPDKLSRALQNLVFNAVSFTPEDGEIALSLRPAGEYARIAVSTRRPKSSRRSTPCPISSRRSQRKPTPRKRLLRNPLPRSRPLPRVAADAPNKP